MNRVIVDRIWMVFAVSAVMLMSAVGVLATNHDSDNEISGNGLYGGTLKIGFRGTVPSAMDPRTETSKDVWNIYYRMFDTLAVINKTDGSPQPWLIKDNWKWDETKKQLTIILKEGIKFHDGNVITPADVKATFTNADMKNNPLFKNALSKISGVDTSGQNIIFTFSEPYAPFYFEALAKVPVMPSSYNPSLPVGSGPFKFVKKTAATVELETFAEYFYTPICNGPFIDGIEFKAYSGKNATSDALAEIKAGTLDYISWALETTDLGAGIPIVTSQDYGFYYMAFNMSSKPLYDKNFRYAMSLCVDKKTTVVQSISNFGTIGSAAVSAGNELFHNGSVMNDYIWIKDVTGDGKIEEVDVTNCLAPVKENLTKFGYLDVDGDGRRDEPGSTYPDDIKSFSVKALVPTAALNANEDRITSSVVTNMRNVGVSMVESKFSVYSDRDKTVASGEWGIYFGEFTPTSPDPSYLYDMFHSSGTLNTMKYSNSVVDSKLTAANKEMDLTKRAKLIKDIQGLIAEDMPLSVIYYPIKIESKSTAYDGWINMVGGIGNTWSFLNVHKPLIGSLDIDVESEHAVDAGGELPIVVKVKTGETAVPNATVDISVNYGQIIPDSGTVTDLSGEWKGKFKAPAVNKTTTVTCIIKAMATQYNEAQYTMFITIKQALQAFKVVATSAEPAITSGDEGTIRVSVKTPTGSPVSGAKVTLDVLYLPKTGVTITPEFAMTDSSGIAEFKFKAEVQTDTLYTLIAYAVKANWTSDSSSGNIVQMQVNAKATSGGIPGYDAPIIIGGVLAAFVVVSIAFGRRKRD